MLKIIVPGNELFDEESQEFTYTEDVVLELEHSLVSLSKWESKYKKPFLTKDEKTNEEAFGYIECMILNPEFPPDVLYRLTQEHLDAISEYMNDKMTATWFNELPGSNRSRQIITAELIYSWMVAFQIDFDPARNWHLNQLMTLIKVCNAQQQPPKKQNPAAAAAERARINEMRRKQLGTRG